MKKLSIFHQLLLFLCLAMPDATARTIQCPNCGNISVPYPFSTSPSCGHPSYPIQCTRSGYLQLEALSGNYTINSINPESRTFVISTGPFLANSCISQDSVYAGKFSLNKSGPFTISQNNTVFVLNATESMIYSPLVCKDASPCSKALIVFPQQSCRDLLCCSFSTSAASVFRYGFPTSGQETAWASVVGLNASTAPSSWTYGLQISWSAPQEPPCYGLSQCGANSICSSRDGFGGKLCLCNAGYVWDSINGICSRVPYCARKGHYILCHKIGFAIGLTLGLLGLITMITYSVYMYRQHKSAQKGREKLIKERREILAMNCGGRSARLFTSQEMKQATNNYARNRVLGCGGFGEVYKGFLKDGSVVAIKCAKIGNMKGTEQVLNEVRVLSQVNHKNLVRLLGCCVESQLPLIVYEYVSNGNLYDRLSDDSLDWKTRLRIGFQAAQGLAYLHSSAYPPIYHCDVKSSNILLDQAMNAKVSDFGLSRLAEPDMSHVSTCAQGTLGYLDPEYHRSYRLTDKSDVYSFGVVLLELVTARRAIDFRRNQEEVNLVVMVENYLEKAKLQDLLDPKITKGASVFIVNSMLYTIMLALECLKDNRTDRPSMKEVAQKIEQIISSLEAAEQEYQVVESFRKDSTKTLDIA